MPDLTFQLPCKIRTGLFNKPTFVIFTYRSDDPFVVALRFTNGVKWMIGRDLLAQGITEGSGNQDCGDILIKPVHEGVEITLIVDKQQTTLLFPHKRIAVALQATYRLVPSGSEKIDWNKETRLLLGGSR